MQRILFRSPRTAPGSHCILCLNNVAEGLTPRTTSTARERSLRIEGPVIVRYTSILAPDARAKSRCRREREEQVADVREEADDMGDEGSRSSDALSSRQTPNSPCKVLQTRPFHTLSTPYRTVRFLRTQNPCRFSHWWSTQRDRDLEAPVVKEFELENAESLEDDEFDMAIDVEELPEWLRADEVRAKAIRKLALKQLAIRLIIRPAVAHAYFGVLKNYDHNDSFPQLDLASLLFELNAIRRRIRQIKANPKVNIDDLMKGFNSPRWEDLVRTSTRFDKKIRQDTDQFLSNEMPLEELLLRLSDALLHCHDPDRTYAFTYMIIAFTKTRQNDLAQLVIKTILPYKFEMSASLILAILNFFRKTKDLKGFDLFLKMLEGKGYPINMGTLGLYRKRVVNGLEISVPPVHSANIVVYAALIKACLRFDQPDRADAYLLVARSAGYMDDFAILMAYLEFCTVRKNWERGRQVLQRVLAFITSTTEHPPARVERLIVMMIQLCDTCQMLDLSEALIKAAVHSGFSSDLPSRQADIVSEADPDSHRWWVAAQDASPSQLDAPLVEKCYAFANIAKEQLDIFAPKGEDFAHRLQRVMGTYSDQLMSTILDEELAQKAVRKTLQSHQEPDKLHPTKAVELDHREGNAYSASPSRSLEDTVAAQQKELRILRSEVAFLKQLVMRMAASNTPVPSTLNEPSELADELAPVRPRLGETETLPQGKKASTMDS
ncbi:uncharacterized protein BDW70DRAFT_42965 [Aspergillus foveolatus]|uniref:uncharacterized protein n=1 Tax=Aspergillus foveolatus TaxID=210207 RepID=UPI003CCE0599